MFVIQVKQVVFNRVHIHQVMKESCGVIHEAKTVKRANKYFSVALHLLPVLTY